MSRCHYHTILFLNYNNVLSGIHLPATMIAWDELHPLKFSLIVGIKQYSFQIAWSGIVWIKIHYFTETKMWSLHSILCIFGYFKNDIWLSFVAQKRRSIFNNLQNNNYVRRAHSNYLKYFWWYWNEFLRCLYKLLVCNAVTYIMYFIYGSGITLFLLMNY